MRSHTLCGFVFACQFSVASAVVPTVLLNNGVQMPMMMFGTGTTWGNSTAAESEVRTALEAGFPAVDAALSYNNQEGVGRALAEVERSSVFVLTKTPAVGHTPETAYNKTWEAAFEDLAALNLDYVDIVIVHNIPMKSDGTIATEGACKIMQEQWRALEDFKKFGKARAIGVSNYCQSDLACILETAWVKPAINQLLVHVGMSADPRGIVSSNKALGIQTMAYQPLGAWNHITNKMDHTLITGNFTKDIGMHYNKSGVQVALRWLAQHDIAFATSSSSKSHLLEDVAVFNFTLDDVHMQELDAATSPPNEPNDFASDLVPGWIPPAVCGSTSSAITV